jgi:hypothetical protein
MRRRLYFASVLIVFINGLLDTFPCILNIFARTLKHIAADDRRGYKNSQND